MANRFMRALLSFFSPPKTFGGAIVVRLLTVLSVLVLFTPPQFADAKINSSIVLDGLPTPSMRFVRKTAGNASDLSPTPVVLKATQTPQQEARLNSATPTAQPDDFALTVSSAECTPWKFCEKRAGIEIRAVGHLNKSKISKIQVQVGEQGKVFNGDTLTIRLPLTQGRGNWLNYWAIAEDGTQSPINTIKYLNYKTDSEQDEYYFALLGAAWMDGMPSGSLLWEMFPPIGADFPSILEQPLTAGYLYTTNRYSSLAGRLILSGQVKANDCADGGVYSNGYATPCGDKQAAEKVLEWQNRYNEQIYDASVRNKIPARILKAMLAQETQFWPSAKSPYEIGLGSLTENGVEMLLAWNKPYFLTLCSAAYGKKACAGGYFYLHTEQQVALRQSVWAKTLSKDEMDVLAAVLFASAAQVNQMVNNTMYTTPGEVASYEDMWKIAVANYHSGSGCIGTGMQEVAKNRGTFTWKAVSSYVLGDCKQAITYVDNVWRYAGGQP